MAPLKSARGLQPTQMSRVQDYDKLGYGKFLDKPARFVFRSTSIAAQYEAVRAGAGLAVLPAFMADRDPTLVRERQGELVK